MRLKLGNDLETGEPVTLDGEPRTQGLYVVGLQGTGKSTLLLNLIHQDMEAGHGLCLLDPHGDLVRDVLARVPPERQQDVLYLNPLDYEHPFGLNLFECQDPEDLMSSVEAQEQILHVFEKVWYPEGGMMDQAPQLTEVLSNLSYLLISNQGYTMAEIPLILHNDVFRNKLVQNVTNPRVKQWWETVYRGMPPEDRHQYAASTTRRIERFLQNPILYNIVAQSHTTVDFRAVMDEGKILIISLPRVRLGSEAVTLLGSIFISQLLMSALSRDDTPTSERKFFALYADEYWRFAISDFASLLAEVRKYNVATTIAHQWLGQLDKDNQSAVKSTVNKVVFQVSPDDAHEFSKGFYHDPGQKEIIGYRPVQAISPHPLQSLLDRGDPNPLIRELVRTRLMPIKERAESERRHSRLEDIRAKEMQNTFRKTVLPITTPHDYATQFRMALSVRAAEIADQCEKVLDLVDQYLFLRMESNEQTPEHIPDNLLVRMAMAFHGLHSSSPYTPSRKEVSYRESYEEIKDMVMCLTDADKISKLGINFAKIRSFLYKMIELGDYLVEHPLMVQTAQQEPIYERPRAYSDVQAEVASALAHTPIRQARCRIIQDRIVVEHTITTDPPPATTFRFTPSLQGTPRAEVEEQIRQRQQGHQLPPTPQRARRFGNR